MSTAVLGLNDKMSKVLQKYSYDTARPKHVNKSTTSSSSVTKKHTKNAQSQYLTLRTSTARDCGALTAQKSERKLKKSVGFTSSQRQAEEMEDFSRADFAFENLDEIVRRADETLLNQMVAQSLSQATSPAKPQPGSQGVMVRGFSQKKLPAKLETSQ